MSQIDYLRTRLPIPTSHCSGPHASHNLALTCGRLRRVGNKNPSPYLHLFRRGCIALAAHRSQQERCSAQQREEHRMDCPYQSRISPFSSFRVPPTTSQSSSAGSPLRSAERRTFQSKSPNSFASSIGGCSVRNIRTLRNSAVSSIDIFNSSSLRRGVMGSASSVPRSGTIETSRQARRETDTSVGDVLSNICKLILWPENTAACLAAEADCSVRQAERFLGGHCEWSGDAQAAVIAEILRRKKMRNVRIVARP